MPDDEYPPGSIRVLAGLEPPVRDPNDPRVRWAREFLDDHSEPLLPVTSPRVQADLEAIMRDIGFSVDMIRGRFPTAPGERVALPVEDLTDDAGAPGGVPGGSRKPAGEPIE